MVTKLETAYREAPGTNNLTLFPIPCLLHDPLCDLRFTIYGLYMGPEMRYFFAEGHTGS